MSEFDDGRILDHLLGHSLLLKSLRATLDKMLENSFIRKDMAIKIVNEASSQYRTLLTKKNFILHTHAMVGQLYQYRYKKDMWIFYVKNPTISLCINDVKPEYYNFKDVSLSDSLAFSNVADVYNTLSQGDTQKVTPKRNIHYNGCIKVIAAFDDTIRT